MMGVTRSYSLAGQHAEALKLSDETLALQRAKLGPHHPYTLRSMLVRADIYARLGRHADAIKLGEEVLPLMRATVGSDHPVTLNSMATLAASYANVGQVAEAIKLLEELLAIAKAERGLDYPHALANLNHLARRLLGRKDLDAARRLLEGALPHLQAARKAAPDHPEYRSLYRFNRWVLAQTLVELKDHAGAVEAVGQFLQIGVDTPREAYLAAGLLTSCAWLAARDERLPESRRQELAASYRERAQAAWRQASAPGAK
jgi:tetratricopeptide (TPR) repeat protein